METVKRTQLEFRSLFKIDLTIRQRPTMEITSSNDGDMPDDRHQFFTRYLEQYVKLLWKWIETSIKDYLLLVCSRMNKYLFNNR